MAGAFQEDAFQDDAFQLDDILGSDRGDGVRAGATKRPSNRVRYLIYREDGLEQVDDAPAMQRQEIDPDVVAEAIAALPAWMGWTEERADELLPSTVYVPLPDLSIDPADLTRAMTELLRRMALQFEQDDEDDIELLLLMTA